MEGSTQVRVDLTGMAPEHLVKQARDTFDEVKPQIPRQILDRLEPIWFALVERVEALGTG